MHKADYTRCPLCNPIPGEEVVGFKIDNEITVHKRNCPTAIRMASKQGDSIVSVKYEERDDVLYPVTLHILAIDRYHLLFDIINCITTELHLSMQSLNTTNIDSIANLDITVSVHSYDELQTIMSHIAAINGVDEVNRQVQN